MYPFLTYNRTPSAITLLCALSTALISTVHAAAPVAQKPATTTSPPAAPTTATPASAPVPATTTSGPNEQLAMAKKLWVLTNGDKTLTQIKAGLSGGEGNLSVAIDKSMAEKITGVLNQALDPVPELVQVYIAEHTNPTQLTAIIKWLESPFGKKVREAEAKANINYADFERALSSKEPKFSKEREILFKRFEPLAYDSTNKMYNEVSEFYTVVNNSTKPPTERVPAKQLEQQLKLARNKNATVTQQLLPHLFANVYREMIVDELKVYIDFLDSLDGRIYTQVTTDGFVNALQKTRPDVLLKLADIFEDELAVLSPYSKEVLSPERQKQLMTTMMKRFGKAPLIGAVLEMRGGQITIVRGGAEQEVFGRPDQNFISVDTLLKDLRKSQIDMRRYYQVVQKRVRMGQ